MKKTYTMNGNTYTSLTAIAKELGLTRIRPSQFDKHGIVEVNPTTDDTAAVPTMAPVAAAPVDTTPAQDDTITVDTQAAGDTATKTDEPDQKDEPTQDDTQPDPTPADEPKKDTPKSKTGKAKADKQPKAPKEPTLAETIQAAGEISEDISKTVSLEDFSKTLRKIPLDVLEACATKAGVDLPAYTSAPIQRMHLTLNLRDHFYPGQKIEPKKSSLFRKIPLDTLCDKAAELQLSYHYNDAMPDNIVRMWVTKALMDAGVKAEDLMPQPDPTPADDTTAPADTDKGVANAG